ncbi:MULTISPECIES: hypothetical protein [Acetobacter]|uniref:hypothetical protein n=1 Tax=Acetobacter TaxID=434 RepID=UPI00376F47F1
MAGPPRLHVTQTCSTGGPACAEGAEGEDKECSAVMRLSNGPLFHNVGLWQAWGSNNQPSATHMAKKTHHRVHPCLPGTPPADNART